MEAIIYPSKIHGEINVPASKSIMQRVCAAALLHKGTTIIHNAGVSDDDIAVLNIIQQLGATVNKLPGGSIEIISSGTISKTANEINCGQSGLAARLFLPIVALGSQPIIVTGTGSLLNRPMYAIIDLLPQLQVTVTANDNGLLPVTIQGPLQPQDITIDGSVSSQFLSGLLFAFCHAGQAADAIEVKDLKSKPYIDLTIDVLQLFGYTVTHNGYKTFQVPAASYNHQERIETIIEGDWSSAAFLLVAAAISGSITLNNLDKHSKQADAAILSVLEKAGAGIEWNDNSITVSKKGLNGFEFDATDCPDLFPVLAILAACCEGESYIHGLHRLYHKESNRVESITEMLQQFGVFFSIEDDALYIEGNETLHNCLIDSYNDHRIVMAAAVGSLRADEQVTIKNAEAVSKSYPDFFKHFSAAGINISLKEN